MTIKKSLSESQSLKRIIVATLLLMHTYQNKPHDSEHPNAVTEYHGS